MSENAAKLEKLRKEIEGCSESEAAAIVEAAQKAADEALGAAEKEMRRTQDDSTRETIEKFRLDERRRVSEKRFSEGRRVLLYRTQLADEFFARVEAEIKAETGKGRYRDYLERSIAEAEECFSLENAEVYCREADMTALKELVSGKGAQVLVSDSIALGGIIVKIPGKGVIMDLSLDAALEKEREQFSASAQMQL